MAEKLSDLTRNIGVNPEIKIGILALFINVILGLVITIFQTSQLLVINEVTSLILIVLVTTTTILYILFGISFYYISRIYDSETGLISSITFIIVQIINLIGIYAVFILGYLSIIHGFVFLISILTFLLFLYTMSQKYEENIILITMFVWIVAFVLTLIFITIPIIVTINLVVRDSLTTYCFIFLVNTYDESEDKKDKDPNYKHVKVTYDSDD